jgi:hypothetical protein
MYLKGGENPPSFYLERFIMKKIEFIRDFTSPVYGNVWIGRTSFVKPTEAEKLIASKNAIYADEKIKEAEKPKELKEKDLEKEKENVSNQPKRGKKSSKNRSK